MPSGSSDDRRGPSSERAAATGTRYGRVGFVAATLTVLLLELLAWVFMLYWYLLPVTVLPAVVTVERGIDSVASADGPGAAVELGSHWPLPSPWGRMCRVAYLRATCRDNALIVSSVRPHEDPPDASCRLESLRGGQLGKWSAAVTEVVDLTRPARPRCLRRL